jgi:hypothetical protein
VTGSIGRGFTIARPHVSGRQCRPAARPGARNRFPSWRRLIFSMKNNVLRHSGGFHGTLSMSTSLPRKAALKLHVD